MIFPDNKIPGKNIVGIAVEGGIFHDGVTDVTSEKGMLYWKHHGSQFAAPVARVVLMQLQGIDIRDEV